jgi:hypothetical protein
VTKKQDQDKPKSSGRYRKVEVRTWGDKKFRELSPMPPCGQGLWLFLITGPHTGPIPGLFRAGRAAMAEELGWELEAFDKAFGEAFRQGMVEADFRARVMWVPNALKHNKPESPNVVKSWASEFDLIPECDLKWRAFDALRASIHALGEAYGEAFDKTFAKPSGKPSPKTTGNQEQEQEQEQDSSSLRSEEGGADKPRTPRPKREDVTLKAYLETCRLEGRKPLPQDHPIRDYCRDAGISEEMLQVAWCVFRDDYTSGTNKAKRYKDWPGHFANSVRGCWAKLWFTDAGEVKWTSRGMQEKQVLETRQRTKGGGNA